MNPEPTPAIRFVRGRPTAEEIAAVVTVLRAASTSEIPLRAPAPVSTWASPARTMTTAPTHPAGPRRPWLSTPRGT